MARDQRPRRRAPRCARCRCHTGRCRSLASPRRAALRGRSSRGELSGPRLARQLRFRLTRTWSAAAFVVALGFCVGLVGLFPIPGALIALALATWAWISGGRASVACLAIAPLILAIGVPWPIPALLAVGLARIADIAGASRLEIEPGGLPRGVRDGRAIAETIAIAIICVPIAAGLAGVSLEGQRFVLNYEYPGLWVVGALVLSSAVVNATAEELYWRGRSTALLVAEGRPAAATIGFPALSFGLAHASGLPGGVLGLGSSLGFGLVVGVLRRRRAGLLGCVIVHAAVDVAIFGVAADRIVWVGQWGRP